MISTYSGNFSSVQVYVGPKLKLQMVRVLFFIRDTYICLDDNGNLLYAQTYCLDLANYI